MGKPLTIVTDRQPNKFEQFLLNNIRDMASVAEQTETEIDGVYFSASFANGLIASAHDGLTPMGIAEIAASAMLDAVDEFITKNFQRYFDMMESGEMDEPGEGDGDADADTL